MRRSIVSLGMDCSSSLKIDNQLDFFLPAWIYALVLLFLLLLVQQVNNTVSAWRTNACALALFNSLSSQDVFVRSCKPLSDAESVRVCVSNGVLSTQSLIKVAFV